MSLATLRLVTYLWHYLVVRLLLDQLVRPAERGDGPRLVLLAFTAATGFMIGRITAARR